MLVNDNSKSLESSPVPTLGDNSPEDLHEKLKANPFKGNPHTRWKWDHKRYSAQYGTAGIEILDNETGQVVAVSKTLQSMGDSLENMAARAVEVTLEDGRTLLVDPSIPTTDLHNRISPKHRFSPVLCELICNLVAQGKTVHEIAGMSGMPSTMTIRKWRREHKEFDDLWRLALQDYAELKAHKALQVAEEAHVAGDPDLVGGAKLFVDTLKWASEKSDPDKFGTKIKTTGEVKHSISLVVDTGIRRIEDEGFTAPPIEDAEIVEEKDHGLLPPVEESLVKHEENQSKETVAQEPVSQDFDEMEESLF